MLIWHFICTGLPEPTAPAAYHTSEELPVSITGKDGSAA
jgi:hypothetical protein